MDKNESENITRLDYFFDMFDAVEEDISQLVSEENDVKLIGGYECLFIAFSNLSLYCENSGINLRQIEDQYQELKESPTDEKPSAFLVDQDLDENNEIVNFCIIKDSVTTPCNNIIKFFIQIPFLA